MQNCQRLNHNSLIDEIKYNSEHLPTQTSTQTLVQTPTSENNNEQPANYLLPIQDDTFNDTDNDSINNKNYLDSRLLPLIQSLKEKITKTIKNMRDYKNTLKKIEILYMHEMSKVNKLNKKKKRS